MSDQLLVPTSPETPVKAGEVLQKSDGNISVCATAPDEFGRAQTAITEWCAAKWEAVKKELAEMKAAFDTAVKRKWAAAAIGRQVKRLQQRSDFYEKLLVALQKGFCIVPNFPVTAFAVRTDRKNPLKMWTTHYTQNHTQKCQGLPVGEGEYKNPFPVVLQDTQKPATATTREVVAYWADSWKDLEWPITMAKPELIEITSQAMALKVFDEIAMLPGYVPGEGTRPPKGDPIIVGRIYDPTRSTGYRPRHYVTLMICWHLDTTEL